MLWRGTASNVTRAIHGQKGFYHDVGHGLYLTNQEWLAEGYARLRSSEAEGSKPILLHAAFPRNELPPGSRILNLTGGSTGALWEFFLRSEAAKPGGFDIFNNVVYRNQMWGQTYYHFFTRFLKMHNLDVNNYDIILAPEYVRDGIQIVVRNEALEKKILAKMNEYTQKKQWVRVYDTKGVPFDTDINDARNYQQNRRLAEQALKRNSALSNPAVSTEVRTLFRRDGRYAAGTRVAAAGLGILEVARIVFGCWLLSKNTPTKAAVIQSRLAYEINFWRRRGAEVTIAGMVTGGNAACKGVTGKADGKEYPATGRILWGVAYENPGTLDLKNIEFFTAYHDGIYIDDPQKNPLDKHLRQLRSFIRFLQDGNERGFLLIADSQAKLPIIDRTLWWVPTKQPTTPGGTELKEIYWPLDNIVARIKQKLIDEENKEIASQSYTVWPANSRLYHRLNTDEGRDSLITIDGGDSRLQIKKNKTWKYKAGQGELYSVMTESRGVEKLAGSEVWGKHTPTFYQVGATDFGSPFWTSKGLLLTGADPKTNAILYEVLWRKEWRSFVASYDPNLTIRTAVDLEQMISSWVPVPLMYVELGKMQ